MTIATVLLLSTIFLFIVSLSRRSRRALPLPPSPRKYPIIGNFFNVPKEQHGLQYRNLSREFDSDIIHLQVFGHSQLILNSLESANELLNRRSAIYSSRPSQPMMTDILGQSFNMAFIPYGDRWRARRRAFWQEFAPSSSHLHKPVQTKSARYLLRLLLQDPDNFLRHIRYSIGSSILEISYGIVPKPTNDPIIALADQVLRRIHDAPLLGSFLVDVFPALKNIPRWMPGAGFRRLGDVALEEVKALLEIPYAMAYKSITNKSVPSFVSRGLSRLTASLDKSIFSSQEEALRDAAAVAYEAGSDTTPSAVSTFVAAMLLYPTVQEKAQRELDNHLNHLPEFSDRDSLPYTQAIVLETLRWQPVVPIGVPHSTIMEDEYKGYYIPNNTAVLPNIWAILNDELHYPNPREFHPERFLKDGKVDQRMSEEVMATFGFGRRICPGRFMAIDSIWIYIASILYTFNICNAVDEHGQSITPNIEYIPAFIRQVVPFKCSIQPRSEKAQKMIEDSDLYV